MELMESIYVDRIMDNFPTSTSYMDSLREHLKANSVCSKVMTMCQDGWLEFGSCEGTLKLYQSERAFLTVQGGVLLKGTRLVIHAALRNDVLSEGHQGASGGDKV